MPGYPDAKFNLRDMFNETGASARTRINELNAALRALGAGTIAFDALSVTNAAGAVLNLGDPDAGTNVKRVRWNVIDGVAYLQVLNDDYTVKSTPLTISLATGEVMVPPGKLTAEPEAWKGVGPSGVTPMLNGWGVLGDSPVRFRKKSGGVELAGHLDRGAGYTSASAFALIAGYCPPYPIREVIPASTSSGGFGVINIGVDGNVTWPIPVQDASLDNVWFPLT